MKALGSQELMDFVEKSVEKIQEEAIEKYKAEVKQLDTKFGTIEIWLIAGVVNGVQSDSFQLCGRMTINDEVQKGHVDIVPGNYENFVEKLKELIYKMVVQPVVDSIITHEY